MTFDAVRDQRVVWRSGLLTIAAIACNTGPEFGASTDFSHPETRRLRPAFHLADSLRLAWSLTEADQEYVRLEDSLGQAGDTAGVWRAHWLRADVQQKAGNFDSAQVLAAEAMILAYGDPRREGWVQSTESFIAFREGRMEESLDLAEQMLTAAATSGDVALELEAYNQSGRTYSVMGRHRDALRAHEQALGLLRSKNADAVRTAQVLNETAIDYRRLGRYDDARHAYETALEAFREAGDDYWIAVTSYNLSNVLKSIGDRAGALQALSESLERSRITGDPRGLAFVHGGLAALHLEIGNTEAARLHLDSAAGWNRAARHPLGVAQTREDRARLEIDEGKLSLAHSLLAQAISIADSSDFGARRASSRDALARLRIAQDRAADAVAIARGAAAIADSLDDPALEIQTLETLALAYEARGDTAQALQANTHAIDLLESWRTELALGDQRRGIWDPRLGPYEHMIRLLSANGRDAQAFNVAEKTRARLLLDIMARSPERADADTVIRAVRRRLEDAFALRATLSRAEWDSVDGAMAAMRDTLDRLEAAVRQRDPVVGAARYPQPASVESLRRVLIGRGRTLITYFWGDDDVFAWSVSDDEIRTARLGAPHELGALVDFLRQTAFRPDTAIPWTSAARRAFDMFVRPVAPNPADELLIVPSGPLNGLPFEILLTETGQPLGAATPVAYGPSASVLATLAATPLPEEWSGGVLAVGDPQPSRRIAGSGTRGGMKLGPLPFAAEEARTVASLIDGERAVLVGRDATIEEWLARAPRRYRYLHFGAHAVVDERRVDQTFVQLADAPLHVSRIQQTPLTAELVTLSACESGLGQDLGGEGIVGLTHAFLAAGARGALVTLWRVPDRLARDFTVAFYTRIAAGHDPVQALHTVKREWISAGRHPSEWGGFVIVGGLSEPPGSSARR